MTVTQPSAAAEDIAAAAAVPERIVAAWADHDADAFAETFAEDAIMVLPNDVYLTGREAIRSFMVQAFAERWQGTRVAGTPLALKTLADGVTLIIIDGGVMAPGETEVSAEAAIRASWLLTRQDGEWLIAAYQNTPRGKGP